MGQLPHVVDSPSQFVEGGVADRAGCRCEQLGECWVPGEDAPDAVEVVDGRLGLRLAGLGERFRAEVPDRDAQRCHRGT
jgi:hypothetical protein